jgi:hypothetical protein
LPDLILALATWRFSSLLSNPRERGPFDLFGKLRELVGVYYDEYSQCQGKNELAKALCCVWCTSVWVGLILARGKVIRGLAYSAAAIVVERLVEGDS